MIEYIKVIIISLVSGLLAPLPFSHSSAYSFLSYILDFYNDSALFTFYYSVITIAFALSAIVFLRKIYFKGFRALFSTKKSKLQNRSAYRKFMLNLLISLLPAAVMFIPISKEKFLIDVFSDQLSSSHLIVTATCCLGSGLFLLIGGWYAKQKYDKVKRSADLKSIVRFSVYQVASYFLPGVSSVSTGAVSLLISDIDNRVIVREVLTYIAPSALVVSVFRLVRTVLGGIVVNPLTVVLCAVFSVLGSSVMIALLSKVNFRKICVFFSIFSIIFGGGVVAMLFLS